MTKEECIALQAKIDALPQGDERWKMEAVWARSCSIIMNTPVTNDPDHTEESA